MNIDRIIGKWMGDTSLGEEKAALEAWKKETVDNMKALEDIQKIAALSDTLLGYEDFQPQARWDAFLQEVSKKEPAKTKVVDASSGVFKSSNLMRIAAVALVLIAFGFLIRQYAYTGETVAAPLHYAATDNSMEVLLADGSNVTLDKLSDMEVLSERRVALEGRAFFDIESNTANPNFSINLPIGEVTVLGTQFTIDANSNATEVYVEEGKVQYSLGERTWVLVAGDLVRVVDNEVTLVKGKDDNYNSWMNQRLIFRDNNMVEVVDALSRHFKKDIVISNKRDFANCNVVNVFTNATLTDILNDLSKSHGLKYELKGSKLFIVSANC